MPIARTVMIMIRAANMAGSAINAASGQLENLGGVATKLSGKLKSILDIKWIQQTLGFLKLMRAGWFLLAGVISTAIFSIKKKIDEYREKIKATEEVMKVFGEKNKGYMMIIFMTLLMLRNELA